MKVFDQSHLVPPVSDGFGLKSFEAPVSDGFDRGHSEPPGENKKYLETGENEKCPETGEEEKNRRKQKVSRNRRTKCLEIGENKKCTEIGETTGKKCLEIGRIQHFPLRAEQLRPKARREKFTLTTIRSQRSTFGWA